MDIRQTPDDLKTVQMDTEWFSTPQYSPDYRGPVSRRFQPLPDPSIAKPFVQALSEVVDRWPELIAASGVEGSMSYKELWQAVQRVAAMIHHKYPGNGAIGIFLPSSALYVVAVFACLTIGRISVLLDEAYPAGRNAEISASTGITLLLVGERSILGFPGLDLDVLDIGTVVRSKTYLQPPPDPPLLFGDPAFILCTSGSTGQPKAIVHSQETMFHWARTTHNALHVRSDDCALSLSSMASLGGFTSLLSYPLAGARQEMFDIKSQGISGLFDTLAIRPVTILRSAPSMLRSLCALPEATAAFIRLRIVQTFGEPLTRADAAIIRAIIPSDCRIRTTYGSTECSGLSWFADPSDSQHPVFEPAGVLMPDTEAAIVDDNGRSCAQGETGELLIRSRYNALGEWIGGRLVPGRMQPDPYDPQIRIYHTNDIARVDSDGVFIVLGRKDRMLKINGQRLEPAEIEAVLREHSEVSRAEAIADLNAPTTRLFAFVVPAPDAGPNLARRLKATLRARLPNYMVPSRVILLSSMPLLPGGKVDANALLQEDFGQQAAPSGGA